MKTVFNKISKFLKSLWANKVFKTIFIILISWPVIHMAAITIDGLTDEIGQADVAVVLGNRIEKDGQPSIRLQSRLNKTIQLYQKNYFKKIIVSGGLGKEGFDEATVMKDYLVKNKIPGNEIIADHQGLNTWLTAQNTKKFMDENHLKSAFIITNYYHIPRTKLAFAKVGIPIIYSAHAEMGPEIREPYSLIREFVGVYSYLVK